MQTEKTFDRNFLVTVLVAAAASALFGAEPSPTELAFGPGQGSRFYVNANEQAVVVGVSSLTWENFAKRTYKGEQSENDHSTHSYWVFDDARIVDAEKNSTKDDYDDFWCSALSRMNIYFWGGWIGGYASEDAVKDYMREHAADPAVSSDVWGFESLLSDGYSDDSVIGGVSSLQTFTAAFEGADRLFVLGIDYDDSYIWKGYPGVSHEVVCCGYSLDASKSTTDPSSLKALFIIDSDNDMYNGAGGSSAPDSIAYCPVSWNAARQCYSVTGVFGATGTFTFDFMSYIRAKKTPPVHFTSAAAAVPKGAVYTVKFDGNGGTSGSMSKQKIATGATKALTANAFKRTGYTFQGWAKKKNASTATYKDRAEVKDIAAAGKIVTLYAVWKANTYKVKFDANGGKGKMANLVMTYGKAKALRANKFTRSGYTFKGWAKAKKAKKAIYKDKAKVKNLKTGGTVKLYAVWKFNGYTVEFDGNGATSGKVEEQPINVGEKTRLTANAFARTGYKFKGWATVKNASTAQYRDKAKVKDLASPGKSVKLYAVWEANTYKVKFNANGGTGKMANLSMTYDKSKALTANKFKRTGCKFLGWSKDKNATTATYKDRAKVKNLEAKGTVTLYAVWQSQALAKAKWFVGTYSGTAERSSADGNWETSDTFTMTIRSMDDMSLALVDAALGTMREAQIDYSSVVYDAEHEVLLVVAYFGGKAEYTACKAGSSMIDCCIYLDDGGAGFSSYEYGYDESGNAFDGPWDGRRR